MFSNPSMEKPARFPKVLVSAFKCGSGRWHFGLVKIPQCDGNDLPKGTSCWQYLTLFPIISEQFCYTAHGDWLYCVMSRGRLEQKVLELHCYNIQTNRWQKGAVIPIGRDPFSVLYSTLTYANGQLYLMGGMHGHDEGLEKDFSCKDGPPDIENICGVRLGQSVNNVYVFKLITSEQDRHPSSDCLTVTWKPGPKMLRGRGGHSAVAYNDEILIAGGLTTKICQDKTLVFGILTIEVNCSNNDNRCLPTIFRFWTRDL